MTDSGASPLSAGAELTPEELARLRSWHVRDVAHPSLCATCRQPARFPCDWAKALALVATLQAQVAELTREWDELRDYVRDEQSRIGLSATHDGSRTERGVR